jgi:hypothetical protein
MQYNCSAITLRTFKTELDLRVVQKSAFIQYAGTARRAYNPGLVVIGKRLRDCGVAVPSAAKLLERFVYLDNEINTECVIFREKERSYLP